MLKVFSKVLPSFLSKRMTPEQLDQKIPIVEPSFERLNNPTEKGIQVTWIGHASTLVQMEGVNFLTDPVWSERVSPIPFAGPKRYRNTPFPLQKLPEIHFVVISHNHYDHLDEGVVKHFGNNVLWIVPIGHKEWFKSKVNLEVERYLKFRE